MNELFSENLCLNTTDPKGWIPVNRTFIKEFGLLEAVVLGELISEFRYWKDHDKLQNDRSFFVTGKTLQKKLHLTEYKRKTTITSLKKLGVISTTRRGVPATTYYQIHFDRVLSVLGGSLQLGEEHPTRQVNTSAKLGDSHLTINKKRKEENNDNISSISFSEEEKEKEEKRLREYFRGKSTLTPEQQEAQVQKTLERYIKHIG